MPVGLDGRHKAGWLASVSRHDKCVFWYSDGVCLGWCACDRITRSKDHSLCWTVAVQVTGRRGGVDMYDRAFVNDEPF